MESLVRELTQVLSAIGMMVGLLAVVPLLPFVAYVFLRLREGREGPRDPHLGIKCVLHMFTTVSLLVTLMGTTLFVSYFLEPDEPAATARGADESSPELRTGMAMILSGGIFLGLHLAVVTVMTNDHHLPAVRRLFRGSLAVLTGLVTLTALVMFMVALFQKDSRWANMYPSFSLLIVWGPAWLVSLLLLLTFGAPRRALASFAQPRTTGPFAAPGGSPAATPAPTYPPVAVPPAGAPPQTSYAPPVPPAPPAPTPRQPPPNPPRAKPL